MLVALQGSLSPGSQLGFLYRMTLHVIPPIQVYLSLWEGDSHSGLSCSPQLPRVWCPEKCFSSELFPPAGSCLLPGNAKLRAFLGMLSLKLVAASHGPIRAGCLERRFLRSQNCWNLCAPEHQSCTTGPDQLGEFPCLQGCFCGCMAGAGPLSLPY